MSNNLIEVFLGVRSREPLPVDDKARGALNPRFSSLLQVPLHYHLVPVRGQPGLEALLVKIELSHQIGELLVR